jgi:hypothetical protein
MNSDNQQPVIIIFVILIRLMLSNAIFLMACALGSVTKAVANKPSDRGSGSADQTLTTYEKLWKASLFTGGSLSKPPVEQPPPEWSQQYYLGGVLELDGRTSAFLVHRVTGEVNQVILGYDDPIGLRLMSVEETSSPFGLTVAVEMAGQMARISTLQEEAQPLPQPKPGEIKQPPTSPADTQPLANDPWPLKASPSRYGKSPLPSDK